MKNFLYELLDWIYKKKCYFCGKSHECIKMCSDCYNSLEFQSFRVHHIQDGTNFYCAGVYEKNLQKLIRGLKYHNQKDLAYFQAKFMYDYMMNIKSLNTRNFVIIPVPLHKNRLKKRKYNHMELVAEELAKLTGFSTNFSVVKRIKDTKAQYNLSRGQREKNLQNAFYVNQDEINSSKDCDIMLIDDICTTGATFEEIIKEMKKAGFKNITCFATTSAN